MITSIETALVVDDDALMRDFIVETLKRGGIDVSHAAGGKEAKRLLDERDFDLAFVDLKMPDIDGMQILRHMKESGLATIPVIVTAFGTVEQAVEAMKIGAYDFLMKPFSPEQVELIVKRAREWVGLQAQNAYLREELGWKLPRGRQILGQSVAMERLMNSIKQVAGSPSTVLITGESGTGKELAALAIHSLSPRHDGPFVRMNCAAIPDTLMDSELFGHEKGSFTSAISRRLGRFELANRGDLLLDEISEMKIGMQSKLLRVLQESEFERVGGSRTIRTNCRVIATTNKDLSVCVEKGDFREDLYYRLNVLPLHMPPLRDRVDDIPVLANSFLKRARRRMDGHKGEMHFSEDAMNLMCQYPWPGNIRELENLIERLSVMEGGPELGPEVLPFNGHVEHSKTRTVASTVEAEDGTPEFNLANIEQEVIIRAMKACNGHRQQTADTLGISVRTLRNKISGYRKQGMSEF